MTTPLHWPREANRVRGAHGRSHLPRAVRMAVGHIHLWQSLPTLLLLLVAHDDCLAWYSFLDRPFLNIFWQRWSLILQRTCAIVVCCADTLLAAASRHCSGIYTPHDTSSMSSEHRLHCTARRTSPLQSHTAYVLGPDLTSCKCRRAGRFIDHSGSTSSTKTGSQLAWWNRIEPSPPPLYVTVRMTLLPSWASLLPPEMKVISLLPMKSHSCARSEGIYIRQGTLETTPQLTCAAHTLAVW